MRYALKLEMLEREPALSDRRAIRLLRSEFQLAINASHFMALCAEELTVHVISRSLPQEGVAAYDVVMEFEERTPELSHGQAVELLRSEFRRAVNASYFWRVSLEDIEIEVHSRRPVRRPVPMRRAA